MMKIIERRWIEVAKTVFLGLALVLTLFLSGCLGNPWSSESSGDLKYGYKDTLWKGSAEEVRNQTINWMERTEPYYHHYRSKYLPNIRYTNSRFRSATKQLLQNDVTLKSRDVVFNSGTSQNVRYTLLINASKSDVLEFVNTTHSNGVWETETIKKDGGTRVIAKIYILAKGLPPDHFVIMIDSRHGNQHFNSTTYIDFGSSKTSDIQSYYVD